MMHEWSWQGPIWVPNRAVHWYLGYQKTSSFMAEWKKTICWCIFWVFCTTLGRSMHFKVFFSVYCMLFLKFSNNPHNMKALIILSHSWSPFLLLTYLYGENALMFVGHCACFWSIFARKTPPISRELICNVTLLQNSPCPVEWPISKPGIHLSAFCY